MKIGILTWYIGYNVGAALQAKALQYKVQELFPEHNCETIFYQTEEQDEMYTLRKRLRNAINRKSLRSTLVNLYMIPILHKKKNAIDSFIEQYMKISKKKYIGSKEIVCSNEEYDAFICGSDQIWNPYWLDSTYLLDFVRKGKRKISYAASIGVNKIDEDKGTIFLKNLCTYDAISVREKTGKVALETVYIDEKLGEPSIEVVCDPTLLLSKKEWNEALSIREDAKPKDDYVICYFLGNEPVYMDVVKKYATKQNKKIYYIKYANGFRKTDIFMGGRNYKIYEQINPRDFVEIITNAEVVFTDSFHGMCFSLIEETPFYLFDRNLAIGKSSINMSSRTDELLNSLNLTNRKINETTSNAILEEINKSENIQWIQVKEKLDMYYRKPSVNWLYNTLKSF